MNSANLDAAILDPRKLRIANELMNWAQTFLMAESPDVRRPYIKNQTVCPFVAESVEKGFFYQAFHPAIGANEGLIESIMLEYLDVFQRLQPFDINMKYKKTLLVVFPDIPKHEVNVLDVVHEKIKTPFVGEGLMVGQFHEKCEVRGIHNPAFRPSKTSPWPLIAMRHMEVHDIVFLSDGKYREWFAEYNARYGEKFKDPQNMDDLGKSLISYYQKAKEVYLR